MLLEHESRRGKKKGKFTILGKKGRTLLEREEWIERFRKIDSVKILMGLAVVILLVLLLTPSLEFVRHEWKVDDIAPKNMKAPADFLIEDKGSTLKRVQEAENGVLALYDFDAKLIDHLSKRISSAVVGFSVYTRLQRSARSG